MKKYLFVVPHPDDEIVGSCIILRRILNQGNEVHVFFLTNGIISKDSLWFWEKKKYKKKILLRKKEAHKSMRTLGIKNYYFQNIPTRTLKTKIEKTYRRLENIIKVQKIDILFCPAYEGGHQDHDISNFICSKFIKTCHVYEFPEYNFYKNSINCNSFPEIKGKHHYIELSREEIMFKQKCLQIYKSEKQNLNYIKILKESYRPIFNYDYTTPPHGGVLFYNRYRFFSWHPRVDSDKPTDICTSILKSKLFYLK